MGGRPLTALAIAGFPKEADRTLLPKIFAGGLDKLREAGVALLGGHTVQDQEIKFGYAITGEVDPARMLTNAGAREGDALILTKPLGTGIIATALKFERAPQSAVAAATASMIMLNRAAAQVLEQLPAGVAHGCTDITGFGLIGHGAEMADASACTLDIRAESVPALEGALHLASGNIPGGGRTNREHFASRVTFTRALPPGVADLLFDPQTSGGLLISIDPTKTEQVQQQLRAVGCPAETIGCVVARSAHSMVVR
jgi:selenide,water dikinase